MVNCFYEHKVINYQLREHGLLAAISLSRGESCQCYIKAQEMKVHMERMMFSLLLFCSMMYVGELLMIWEHALLLF